MQAMCNYADRWIGLLRLELTVYVDNARGDRALPQVRLRDRRAPARLRDARRRAGRRLHDGAHPSRAAEPSSPARPEAERRQREDRLPASRSAWRSSAPAGAGARGAGVLPEPRRRRQRAGRPHRPLVPGGERQPGRAGAERGPVPRLRRRLRPARPAVAADAASTPRCSTGRLHGPGGRFARPALRGRALHPARRLAPRHPVEPPPRRARRRRLPGRARRRRSAPDRPDRLVERRQHRARGDQPAPSRRRRGRWCSRPSRSPSIPAARPS